VFAVTEIKLLALVFVPYGGGACAKVVARLAGSDGIDTVLFSRLGVSNIVESAAVAVNE
jgi:hypothetical protein